MIVALIGLALTVLMIGSLFSGAKDDVPIAAAAIGLVPFALGQAMIYAGALLRQGSAQRANVSAS